MRTTRSVASAKSFVTPVRIRESRAARLLYTPRLQDDLRRRRHSHGASPCFPTEIAAAEGNRAECLQVLRRNGGKLGQTKRKESLPYNVIRNIGIYNLQYFFLLTGQPAEGSV